MTHGRDLRVFNVIRQLSSTYECTLVDLNDEGTVAQPGLLDFLAGQVSLPSKPCSRSNPLRWMRTSDVGFAQLAYPEYHAHVSRKLAEISRLTTPAAILNFSRFAAEIATGLGPPAILDLADSVSLAMSRALARKDGRLRPMERARVKLRCVRAMKLERSLVHAYDSVTTISDQERAQLVTVSGLGGDRVECIPNGVFPRALEGFCDGPRKRTVVFWGNLDFPPNWTAVRYFFEQVFQKYLAEKNVEVSIIGRGGDDTLADIFSHPKVTRYGFVDDLFGLLSREGALVNCMVEGGGLKNKVLEAFACGLPVVSTKLGLDGIHAQDGVHCLVGDRPRAIAEKALQVLDQPALARRLTRAARDLVESEYTWERAGKSFAGVVERLLLRPPNSSRQSHGGRSDASRRDGSLRA
jgi:glycosyltransferase involved in cell wall biosynthesis